MVDSDGTRYEGDFVDGEIDGRGKMVVPSEGIQYDGEFRNGILHGKGVMTYYDKTTLEGIFINGRLNGKGIKTYDDGTNYKGDFLDSKYHGFGILIEPNGSYEGKFRNGKFNGFGILIDDLTKSRYDGIFRNGEHHKGIMTLSDGSRLNGYWKKGVLQPGAVKTMPDGTTFNLSLKEDSKEPDNVISISAKRSILKKKSEGEMS